MISIENDRSNNLKLSDKEVELKIVNNIPLPKWMQVPIYSIYETTIVFDCDGGDGMKVNEAKSRKRVLIECGIPKKIQIKSEENLFNYEYNCKIDDLEQNCEYFIQCEMYFPFWNLSYWTRLSNGLKFRAKRPKPRIRCSGTRIERDFVEIPS